LFSHYIHGNNGFYLDVEFEREKSNGMKILDPIFFLRGGMKNRRKKSKMQKRKRKSSCSDIKVG